MNKPKYTKETPWGSMVQPKWLLCFIAMLCVNLALVQQAGDAFVSREFVNVVAVLGPVGLGHFGRNGMERRQAGHLNAGKNRGALALA